MAQSPADSEHHHHHHPNKTFASQANLPKLPIPDLEDTCKRYLRALEGLQDKEEHEATTRAVHEFLHGEAPRVQERLKAWASTKDSYIEDFWYESYLSHSDTLVLALNPFFVLEDDPTPSRGTQLPRAASLVVSSLGFIHDLREGLLEPDHVRGIPLDMDQYTRLFGTARIPTDRGCRMQVHKESRHLVVIRRGQFYYFDVLDSKNRPVLTEREILLNLKAICADADKVQQHEVASSAIGVLTTENRKVWSGLRKVLTAHSGNRQCLQAVDDALFVVCLDDFSPENEAELCSNYLCGTYKLSNGIQVGTCTNRWYDKLQIIVCGNGMAGINFEHTGVDGHTVLRFAADVFTEGLMLMERSINPAAPALFKAKLSPHAKSYKPPKPHSGHNYKHQEPPEVFDTTPKKLEWRLTPELRAGIRFAETRISDQICQNDCQALEFKGYGRNWVIDHGFSPDAFVQMAFQAAYYGLYGQTECTYEPAMTKAFLHGRTEAIRTVQPESVEFTKIFFSEQQTQEEKIKALRSACKAHVRLTKECSQGLGQDRHLYALYCLLQREINSPLETPDPANEGPKHNGNGAASKSLPSIFTDHGWSVLNTSILSTSNCGNPALRLFGFGPVAGDGYGIGYIIKEEGISVCASSKHLQTRRFLDTLQNYLVEVQRMVTHLHRAANERPEFLYEDSGVGVKQVNGPKRVPSTTVVVPAQDEADEEADKEEEVFSQGYSFFDSGDVEHFKPQRRRPTVGRVLRIAEY